MKEKMYELMEKMYQDFSRTDKLDFKTETGNNLKVLTKDLIRLETAILENKIAILENKKNFTIFTFW